LKNLAFLVGSGFCPILSRRERRDSARWAPPNGGGRPRAMLAPDTSVWKEEKQLYQGVLDMQTTN